MKREFGCAAGPLGRIVGLATPVGDGHLAVVEAFPPRLVVGGHADVGEDGVALDRGQRIRIGLGRSARRDAEETGFRIDRVQAAIGTRAHPADVVADRPHLPAVADIAFRRDQHRQVGLAAGARERRGDVMRFALRILEAEDQHVLGQPAFAARLVRGDAQRVALLAEQRVAAVAGAKRLDRQFFREMHDVAAVRIEFADRVQAAHERTFALDPRQRRGAHAGHDPHVGDDVRRIGDLDAATRQRRIDRAHAVRDHVHRAAAHAAGEQLVHLLMAVGRRHPVVVGAGIVLVAGADEGEVLDAGDIVGVRAVQPAVRMGPGHSAAARCRRPACVRPARRARCRCRRTTGCDRAGSAGRLPSPIGSMRPTGCPWRWSRSSKEIAVFKS